MAFYKITDPATVEIINNEIKRSNELTDSMLKMAKEHGFQEIVIYDSLRYGINLHGFMVGSDDIVVDRTKWKSTATHRGDVYTPKKTNKAFYREIKEQYEYFLDPKFSYSLLISTYSKVYAPFKTYVFDEQADGTAIVYLETPQLLEQPTDVVIEVLSAEFKAAYERQKLANKEQ